MPVVSVYSEPGRGSTFKVYLPRTGEVAEPLPASPVQQPTMRGKETILVAEDDRQVLDLAVAILEHHLRLVIGLRSSEAGIDIQIFCPRIIAAKVQAFADAVRHVHLQRVVAAVAFRKPKKCGGEIGYIPVVYSSFSRREIQISMLDARAGSPPAAAELLVRLAGRTENPGMDQLVLDEDLSPLSSSSS